MGGETSFWNAYWQYREGKRPPKKHYGARAAVACESAMREACPDCPYATVAAKEVFLPDLIAGTADGRSIYDDAMSESPSIADIVRAKSRICTSERCAQLSRRGLDDEVFD